MSDNAGSTQSPPSDIASQFKPVNGPFMLAGYASCLLYGYYLAQLHVYFNRYAHGDRWLKWLAISIAIISSLTIGFSMASQRVILVEHGGDPLIWASSPWQLALGPLTTGCSAFLVQLFFAARITRLRRDAAGKVSAGLIILVALITLSSALAVTILDLSEGSQLFEIESKFPTVVARHVWLSSGLLCTILIAGLSSFLNREQTHSGAAQLPLHSLASKFIETGMILVVIMLLSVICYETMGARNLTYFIWESSIGPLYGNVMLYILNSRPREVCEEDMNDIELHSSPYGLGSPRMISHILSIGAIDSKLSGGHETPNDIVVRVG